VPRHLRPFGSRRRQGGTLTRGDVRAGAQGAKLPSATWRSEGRRPVQNHGRACRGGGCSGWWSIGLGSRGVCRSFSTLVLENRSSAQDEEDWKSHVAKALDLVHFLDLPPLWICHNTGLPSPCILSRKSKTQKRRCATPPIRSQNRPTSLGCQRPAPAPLLTFVEEVPSKPQRAARRSTILMADQFSTQLMGAEHGEDDELGVAPFDDAAIGDAPLAVTRPPPHRLFFETVGAQGDESRRRSPRASSAFPPSSMRGDAKQLSVRSSAEE